MPTFELLGQNIASLHFKTDRVAETALRALWFWPTSPRFLGTWEIFSSRRDSKLTPDCLRLQRNEQSKNFWTLNFELLGQKIPPLHFKTNRGRRGRLTRLVILTNLGSISWNLRNIFQSRGLYTNSWWPWFAVKWTEQKFLNAHFRASGTKYSPTSLQDW